VRIRVHQYVHKYVTVFTITSTQEVVRRVTRRFFDQTRFVLANEDLVTRLRAAVETHDIASWNSFRSQNPVEYVDLLGADLRGLDLRGADLRKADLRGADFLGANLSGAYLNEADLSEADLSLADLSGADLSNGDLERALLVRTRLGESILRGCRVYGISAWDVSGSPKDQVGLIVTPYDAPKVTVDNLKLAQFMYLLLHSPEIRDIIDTITSKVVLNADGAIGAGASPNIHMPSVTKRV
jgi:uncharacterized protein YjbI with pentapeptide repeats